jgi:ATP-binding cassette subfamily C (CFTR/MRP) protein 1
MLVLPSISSVLQTMHNYTMNRVGLWLKTVLVTAVFEKGLRLRDREGKFPRGGIVTLCSVDAQQLTRLTLFGALILTAPIQIVVTLWLLTLQVGSSVWMAIALIGAFVPVAVVVFTTIARLRKRVLHYTSKRTALISDILGGLRLVKMFGYGNTRRMRNGGEWSRRGLGREGSPK